MELSRARGTIDRSPRALWPPLKTRRRRRRARNYYDGLERIRRESCSRDVVPTEGRSRELWAISRNTQFQGASLESLSQERHTERARDTGKGGRNETATSRRCNTGNPFRCDASPRINVCLSRDCEHFFFHFRNTSLTPLEAPTVITFQWNSEWNSCRSFQRGTIKIM